MNNNLQKFLSSVDSFHKNIIIENSKNNINFHKLILACSELNISLYDNDNKPKSYNLFLKKIYNFQELIMKNLGIKLVKEYENNKNNVIDFLDNKINTVRDKINNTSTIIDLLNNKIDSNKYIELLTKFVDDRKIAYTDNITYTDNVTNIQSQKTKEIIDFSHDIFITSEDISSEEDQKNNKINISITYSNTPYIAEYSN